MMREIKFRAWDRERQIMRRVFAINFDFDEAYICRNNPSDCITIDIKQDSVIMQFTGLCDKNGKEIYEGDIVRLFYEMIEMVGYIKQSDNGEWLVWKDERNYLGAYDNRNRIVVIGNIYENPNLLEIKNDVQ